jgi:hypothetical protein
MKKLNQIRNVGAALATLATLGLSPNASAISLTWVNGPDAGQAFSGGAIVVKALNYDTGTLYNQIPVGTSLGYTGSPGAGVAGGEALLNAQPGRAVLNGRGSEDSWGIVRITQIQSIGSDGVLHDIYNEAVNAYELTAMFWGIRDYHLTQVSAGSGIAGAGQVIDGTGMRVDIYSDNTPDFNQTAGPGGRGVGSDVYNTVTDGTLELSLLSTPGFINDNGTFGGTAAEFESNTAAVGYAALDVIGGASAWQFDTNSIGFKGSSGGSFVAGKADQTATDIWFAFTSTQGTNGWDINSNDPMLAVINNNRVPEGGSTLLLLGAALAGLGVVYRRRNQAV